jgi:hypothetical protein
MSVVELLPNLKTLSRSEKLQIMQFLVQELTEEEDKVLEAGKTYNVWSPFNSHKAAAQLATLLEEA